MRGSVANKAADALDFMPAVVKKLGGLDGLHDAGAGTSSCWL